MNKLKIIGLAIGVILLANISFKLPMGTKQCVQENTTDIKVNKFPVGSPLSLTFNRNQNSFLSVQENGYSMFHIEKEYQIGFEKFEFSIMDIVPSSSSFDSIYVFTKDQRVFFKPIFEDFLQTSVEIKLGEQNEKVTSFSINVEMGFLVIGTAKGGVYLLNSFTGKVLSNIVLGNAEINDVSIGKELVSSLDASGWLTLLKIEDGNTLRKVQKEKNESALRVCLLKNDSLLATINKKEKEGYNRTLEINFLNPWQQLKLVRSKSLEHYMHYNLKSDNSRFIVNDYFKTFVFEKGKLSQIYRPKKGNRPLACFTKSKNQILITYKYESTGGYLLYNYEEAAIDKVIFAEGYLPQTFSLWQGRYFLIQYSKNPNTYVIDTEMNQMVEMPQHLYAPNYTDIHDQSTFLQKNFEYKSPFGSYHFDVIKKNNVRIMNFSELENPQELLKIPDTSHQFNVHSYQDHYQPKEAFITGGANGFSLYKIGGDHQPLYLDKNAIYYPLDPQLYYLSGKGKLFNSQFEEIFSFQMHERLRLSTKDHFFIVNNENKYIKAVNKTSLNLTFNDSFDKQVSLHVSPDNQYAGVLKWDYGLRDPKHFELRNLSSGEVLKSIVLPVMRIRDFCFTKHPNVIGFYEGEDREIWFWGLKENKLLAKLYIPQVNIGTYFVHTPDGRFDGLEASFNGIEVDGIKNLDKIKNHPARIPGLLNLILNGEIE